MNELHSRICDAHEQSKIIKESQKSNPLLCKDCGFNRLAYEYYNPSGAKKPPKDDIVHLIVIASILGLKYFTS
jgi:hypothetical protein